MSNPREITSNEHIKLYGCYANLIQSAVTQTNIDLVDRHLLLASKWFEEKLEATDFRNKLRGADAENYA